MLKFDERETATLLAALRHWQQHSEKEGFAGTADFDALMQIATCDGDFMALENVEIDGLCERINSTEPVETPADYEEIKRERDLQRIAMKRIVHAIFGRALADDEQTDVDSMCAWIDGLRAENSMVVVEREDAIAECRKRKGIEQDAQHYRERAEDAEAKVKALDSFGGVCALLQSLLDDHYPPNTVVCSDDENADIGAQLTAAARKVLEVKTESKNLRREIVTLKAQNKGLSVVNAAWEKRYRELEAERDGARRWSNAWKQAATKMWRRRGYTIVMRQGNEKVVLNADQVTGYLNGLGSFAAKMLNQFKCANAAKRKQRAEVARLKELVRDYYRIHNFPLDQFMWLALGDDGARKLGIEVAMESGWEKP